MGQRSRSSDARTVELDGPSASTLRAWAGMVVFEQRPGFRLNTCQLSKCSQMSVVPSPMSVFDWQDSVATNWDWPANGCGFGRGRSSWSTANRKTLKQCYRQIQGGLSVIGIDLAPSSVWNILQRHGIDPAPLRRGPTWGELLKAQATTMLACDFFTIDTVHLRGLYALFFIELDSRKVFVTGATAHPTGAWVVQQVRNLSCELDGRVRSVKFLIRDRDAKFTASFDEIFRSEGIRIIRTPIRAPRANAIAERFVGTVRREGLDRMQILGLRHLECVLDQYVERYNGHRPHRSLGQLPPQPTSVAPAALESVDPSRLKRTDRLGGLIHEYRLVA